MASRAFSDDAEITDKCHLIAAPGGPAFHRCGSDFEEGEEEDVLVDQSGAAPGGPSLNEDEHDGAAVVGVEGVPDVCSGTWRRLVDDLLYNLNTEADLPCFSYGAPMTHGEKLPGCGDWTPVVTAKGIALKKQTDELLHERVKSLRPSPDSRYHRSLEIAFPADYINTCVEARGFADEGYQASFEITIPTETFRLATVREVVAWKLRRNRSFLTERVTFQLTLLSDEDEVSFGISSFMMEEDQGKEGESINKPFKWSLQQFETELHASNQQNLLLSIVSMAHRWLDSQ
jgi:hypothetical protein